MYSILVVDDEKIMREGIVKYIKTKKWDVGSLEQASDGLQALEKYKELMSDILITDIYMPKMDGIELAEKAKEMNPNVHIIIISGYDEFKYAQSAVRLGVTDYLLKPFLPSKLDEVLAKVIESIESKKNFYHNVQNLKQKVDESVPLLRERFLLDLVNHHITTNEVEEKLIDFNIPINPNFVSVAIFKTKQNGQNKGRKIDQDDLIQFFLLKILDDRFEKNIHTYAFSISEEFLGLSIWIYDSDESKVNMKTNNYLGKLVESMHKYFDIQICASLGRLYKNVLDISQSFEDAMEAITYSFTGSKGNVIAYDDIRTSREKGYTKPQLLLENVLLNIKLCLLREAINNINEVMLYYKQNSEHSPSFIKKDAIELVVLLQRYIEEKNGSIHFLYNGSIDPFRQIQQTSDLGELQQLLERFVSDSINEIEKAKVGYSNEMIEKLKLISKANIHNEEFTLDDAATQLFISPNYLRQLFKQHTGKTYLEYIIEMKMEMAKELLQDPNKKIYEISESIGYSNQRYFAKCFKKYFNETPTEFRSRIK